MKRLDIRLRLGATFCLLAAVLFIVGWQGVRHLRQLDRETQNAIYDRWSEEQQVREAFGLSDLNSRVMLSILLLDDPDEIKRLLVQRAANTERISELVHAIELRLNTEEEKRLLAAVEAARKPYVESYKQALAKLLDEHQRGEAQKIMVGVALPRIAVYHAAWNAFAQCQIDRIEQGIKQSKADFAAARRRLLFMIMLALLITSVTAVYVTCRVTQEIAERQCAEKDLQESRDQLDQRVQQRTMELAQSNQALQAEITERKQAEEELRLKTAFLEAQVNSSIDGILVVDEQDRKILQNQRTVDLLKIPRHIADDKDDEKQRRWVMSIAKHPAQFIERVIYLNSHPNEISRDELELKDGTILDRYSSPATGKDGKYYGRVWIFRDITARKRAEEALRLLGSAMEQAKESIVITDAELNLPGPKIIFVNPAFTRMTGYTAEEALGKTPRMLQGPRSDRAVLSRLRRNLEQGEVFEGETVNYRKNGEAFNLEWQIAPIRNSSGIITHFVAIQRDITERKRAEEALRTSQQITEGIINAIPVRVFWKDKNLVYLGCNAVFARDAGFADSKDIIGKDDYQMGWRDQAEKYRGDDRQVIEGGCSKLLTEEPQTTPEGKTMTLLSSKIPLRNVKGEISGVIGTYLDITERKQAESLVRQSEERYRSLFDNAKDAIFTIAADGTFTSLNPAVEAMAGISRADWIGQPFAPMVHPDDLPLAGEMFNRTLKGEKTPVHELRGNPSLSRPAIMEMTLAAQKDESGKIIGVLGIGRDITERKQAEEELRLKTAFLEAQVNSSLDGILVVDQNRNVSLQNQRFIDLFKMPLRLADTGADEIRLRWVTDRIKNSEPFVQKVLYLYAHPNEISRDEIELNDGTILDRYSSPAIGKDGKYYGRIWTYHDITERKRDEEALRKIKLQLAHAMSLAQLAAWEYDAASGLFTFSDAYYALHGTTAELENGYRMSAEVFVRKFLHPDDAHLVAAEIGKAVATTDLDYHSQVEARIFRRDGELRHVLVHIAITKDAAGRTIQIQGANQDITERKKLEARLFQSQKMETVGKLAGGIAHEFNSILTAIIGQSELLLGDLPAESPLATSATEISRAANRAATLTRQLLAYGRKQILQPESLDLNKVIASMEGMIHHLLGGDVDVYFVPAHDLQAVKADAGQIEQVVMNVAMNAADAMPQGGKLTIETGNVTLDQEYVSHFPDLKAGGYVMLAITDTGAGMSAEVKARVFEPFFTTKGVGEGTGLGLSTCYGILKQSGGHINVYSEPGHGTTFKIYLPQVEAATTIPSPRLATPDLPRGTETILLVEDDSALREMAATLLKRLGYTVLAAANGIEALTLIHQRDTGHIDLLFTDIVMPHMSGKELADRVQASYPHTRILFTSAYTGNAIVHQGVLDKGVALLQKPFTPAALAHKLREVLDQPIARPPDPAQKSFLFANTSYG